MHFLCRLMLKKMRKKNIKIWLLSVKLLLWFGLTVWRCTFRRGVCVIHGNHSIAELHVYGCMLWCMWFGLLWKCAVLSRNKLSCSSLFVVRFVVTFL
jgi:hypothetical protein